MAEISVLELARNVVGDEKAALTALFSNKDISVVGSSYLLSKPAPDVCSECKEEALFRGEAPPCIYKNAFIGCPK